MALHYALPVAAAAAWQSHLTLTVKEIAAACSDGNEATEMTEAAVNLPIWAMVAECFMATLLWHK